MAIEAKRGCGFRKVGGLYLAGGGSGEPCDRLPWRLDVCPTCSHGIKQARGWTWVDMEGLFEGDHTIPPGTSGILSGLCPERLCPVCRPDGKAGLLWIGGSFYPTPGDFTREGVDLGFSRRIKAIPRGFKVGETWVLLAHPKTIRSVCPYCVGNHNPPLRLEVLGSEECENCKDGWVYQPGIFLVWRPSRIEKIITESQSHDPDTMTDLERRGITAVVVPDDDRDHQGTVYDKDDNFELFEEGWFA